MTSPLPPLAPVARLRPITLVQPGTSLPAAPAAAVEAPLGDSGRVALRSGDDHFEAVWDGATVSIELDVGGAASSHRSRRHGRGTSPSRLGLSLTGPVLTAWVHERAAWVARAVVDLSESAPGVDVHDPAWLADLAADGAMADGAVAGGFGQLGLRDLRLVTHADGTPYLAGDTHVLTATSAGPGGFRTGHCSVWSFDSRSLVLEHRADLFFRRSGRAGRAGVYGDHAVHLLRDGEQWLVAASTWGDFDKRRNPRVGTTLASTTDDLLTGTHVLDAEPLALPTDGLASVGTWDPHLVRTDEGWLATYVSARRFFDFHPVTAAGPQLDRLHLRAAAGDRHATEGPTLARLDGDWQVLASDGRDSRRGRRATYPVLDLDLQQHGTLDAAYPTNLPWPTVLEHGGRWWMLGFDATPTGGGLLGYGTHGDVVVQASAAPTPVT